MKIPGLTSGVSDLYYQMVPIARQQDAVGRMAWAMNSLFESWGKKSLIFTEHQQSPHLGPWFTGPLRKGLRGSSPPWQGRPTPQIAIYQHSIGTPVAERFLAWPAQKKILLYQNITPSNLAGLTQAARHDQDWGREQLGRLIAGSDLQISISEYSCAELRSRGATRVLKLPYLFWRRQIQPGPDRRPGPKLLVVGRVVPHKGIRDAVLTLARLKLRHPAATLTVLGNLRGDPEYVRLVRQTICDQGLEGAVKLAGMVSDRALIWHYRNASALLSLSEHEGFCVPLVEAMQARTPIVAFAAAAVPETLGSGGITIDERSPEQAADALHRLLTDETLRQEIRRGQAREEIRFTPNAFAEPLHQALAALI